MKVCDICNRVKTTQISKKGIPNTCRSTHNHPHFKGLKRSHRDKHRNWVYFGCTCKWCHKRRKNDSEFRKLFPYIKINNINYY